MTPTRAAIVRAEQAEALATKDRELAIEVEWHEHYRGRCIRAEDKVATLTADLETLKQAILPDYAERQKPWTVHMLANLAIAHRDDSEAVDATAIPSDSSWVGDSHDYAKASAMRGQQVATLTARVQALETAGRALAARWEDEADMSSDRLGRIFGRCADDLRALLTQEPTP